jgi:hypothetical protein
MWKRSLVIGENSYQEVVKLCKAVPYREGGCTGAIVGASLVENAGQVVDHGLFAQNELFGNLAVTHALRDETQHFDFPRTQPGRK